MNKPHILIVDDEPSVTRLLKLNLEATGRYEVRAENNPTQVLATVKDFKPDLILMDVMMPGMDGGEISSHLQANPRFKSVPIVFLTAAVKKEEIGSRGGVIGGFPYLAKPIETEEVVACIEKLLATPRPPA